MKPLSASCVFPDPNRKRVRAYDSAGWDRLLHTHPIVPALVYAPLASWALWLSYIQPGFVGSTWLRFVAGLLCWSLIEYGVHRWILHIGDTEAWYNMALGRMHLGHHEHPEDTSQVIISPLQTLPLAALLYGTLRLFLQPGSASAVWAGIAAGYLAYESFHYAFHLPQPLSWRWLSALRKYHARHHFETPDARFGVTSPLWDWAFKSLPA